MKRAVSVFLITVFVVAALFTGFGIKDVSHTISVSAINDLTLNSGSVLNISTVNGKKILTGFGVGHRAEELAVNFINSNSIKIISPDGKELSLNAAVVTGCIVKSVGKTGTVFDSAAVVINGDVTGSGKITVSDYIAVKRALASDRPLGTYGGLAADYDGNGLDANDLVRIISYLKRKAQPDSFTNAGLRSGEVKPDEETTTTVTEKPTTTTTAKPTTTTAPPAVTDDPNKTSTLPKYFSTEAQFKASKAYKSYSAFASLADYSHSIVIPGATRTNVLGTIGTKYAPQGMCFAGSYAIISAYDRNSTLRTVLYVINKSTGKYLKTIVLSNTPHAGGLAYDGSNVWICNGTSVSAIKLSSITTAVSSSSDSVALSYAVTRSLGITASFMTYYSGKLWVGTFNETSTDYMYAYTIGSKTGSSPTLTRVSESASTGYRIQVPDRTQGVCFTSAGYLIVSRSYRASTSATDHIAQVRIYNMKNWSSVTSTGTIEKGDAIKVIAMVPMGEQINIDGNYVYLLFESCAYPSCDYPLDRAVAFPLSKFLA